MLTDITQLKRIAYPLCAAAALLFLPISAHASPINASDLIASTNTEREELGLSPLVPNHKLTQAALAKAQDILKNGYFAHTTPYGKPFYQWIEDEQYHYLYAGENLAIDFSTNEGVMAAWMESPRHRANITNEHYSEIGIVTLRGEWNEHETTVAVQMFGSLLEDSPTVLGRTLDNLAGDLRIRRDDLGSLAADLIILPSLAGSKYFDAIIRPSRNTQLAMSDTSPSSIATYPTTKVAQGTPYRTLLKSESDCCQNSPVFALTEARNGDVVSTPVTYPTLHDVVATIKNQDISFLITPENLSRDIMFAGITLLLLLLAYAQELKKFSNPTIA